MEGHYTVIIDNGSGWCKFGVSNQSPWYQAFLARVATPTAFNYSQKPNDIYVANKTRGYRGSMNIKYPVKHGIITDWENMDRLWKYGYQEIVRELPEKSPCLMIEGTVSADSAPGTPKENREQTIKIMFEKYNVPSIYLANTAVLGLYSSGRTDGLLLGSGFGVTHAAPVQDGTIISKALERSELAGQDITLSMSKPLEKFRLGLQMNTDLDEVQKMKEKICYVSLDCSKEPESIYRSYSDVQAKYTLPDGEITIGSECYLCPEALFQPKLLGKENLGLHEMVIKAIGNCDGGLQASLYQNIMLGGGNTLLRGLPERLNKELAGKNAKIIAPPDRHELVWTGALIFDSIQSLKAKWITKQEYQEHGAQIVHSKCP